MDNGCHFLSPQLCCKHPLFWNWTNIVEQSSHSTNELTLFDSLFPLALYTTFRTDTQWQNHHSPRCNGFDHWLRRPLWRMLCRYVNFVHFHLMPPPVPQTTYRNNLRRENEKSLRMTKLSNVFLPRQGCETHSRTFVGGPEQDFPPFFAGWSIDLVAFLVQFSEHASHSPQEVHLQSTATK